VEFDKRNRKVTQNSKCIRAKSVETFQKELYTAVIVYNLAAPFRRLLSSESKSKERATT